MVYLLEITLAALAIRGNTLWRFLLLFSAPERVHSARCWMTDILSGEKKGDRMSPSRQPRGYLSLAELRGMIQIARSIRDGNGSAAKRSALASIASAVARSISRILSSWPGRRWPDTPTPTIGFDFRDSPIVVY